MIRDARESDSARICEIYNHYIATSIISFEEEPVTTDDMRERIAKIQQKYHWIVYEEDGTVLGYAYAGEWKSRAAYRHSVESSVYIDRNAHGKSIGSKLYAELFERLKKDSIHVIIGGIGLPNDASVALHEKFGFKKVAHLEEVGYKFNTWVDVGYWELILK